jgi:hypothetical protein
MVDGQGRRDEVFDAQPDADSSAEQEAQVRAGQHPAPSTAQSQVEQEENLGAGILRRRSRDSSHRPAD